MQGLQCCMAEEDEIAAGKMFHGRTDAICVQGISSVYFTCVKIYSQKCVHIFVYFEFFLYLCTRI